MIINANAYYHEEDNGELKARLRASVHVDSGTPETDEYAKALARTLYHTMALAMPCEKGERKYVAE